MVNSRQGSDNAGKLHMIYDRRSQMPPLPAPIDMKVFVRAVELESFSAAARDLEQIPVDFMHSRRA